MTPHATPATRTIGRRIYARRRRLYLNQRELGERIAVRDSLICAWEHGRENVRPYLDDIAEALGVSVAWLMGEI